MSDELMSASAARRWLRFKDAEIERLKSANLELLKLAAASAPLSEDHLIVVLRRWVSALSLRVEELEDQNEMLRDVVASRDEMLKNLKEAAAALAFVPDIKERGAE